MNSKKNLNTKNLAKFCRNIRGNKIIQQIKCCRHFKQKVISSLRPLLLTSTTPLYYNRDFKELCTHTVQQGRQFNDEPASALNCLGHLKASSLKTLNVFGAHITLLL